MAFGLIWKPPGLGSQPCLGWVKKHLALHGPAREGIGHTGTLDPFAEGLLVFGAEEGTKILSPLTGFEKTYIAEIVLGVETSTCDHTGDILGRIELGKLNEVSETLRKEAPAFLQSKLGIQMQTPPAHSAQRVDGKRGYEWAHQGVMKTPEAKQVELISAKHRELSWTSETGQWIWTVELRVASGTYIRAFARDWSQELTGGAGHLRRLIRTSVGPWTWPGDKPPQVLEGQDPLVHLFGIDELRAVFDVISVPADAGEAFRKTGNLSLIAKYLGASKAGPSLVADESLKAFYAWLSGEKVGRIFASNPI